MDLKQVMQEKTFVVVGDTINTSKYAYMIKQALLESDYTVFCVGKELESINDIEQEIDIIDLCIHPAKGIQILKELKKPFKYIVIQPGAESPEIIEYLKANNMNYMESCLLVGVKLYKKENL